MPIHDWTRAESGDFHDFHLGWLVRIADGLNGGLLPAEFMALVQKPTCPLTPDVLGTQAADTADLSGISLERINYAKRANRVVIRHGLAKVVAIIEIVSPGNKESRHAIRSFVEKAADILSEGVNLLVVDLFPPTPRDLQGIHGAIWDELAGEPFELPPGKRLTVASYLGGDMLTAYVEPVGTGDALPSLPIFLSEDRYIPAPLEQTYQEAWAIFPAMLKELIEPAGTE